MPHAVGYLIATLVFIMWVSIGMLATRVEVENDEIMAEASQGR